MQNSKTQIARKSAVLDDLNAEQKQAVTHGQGPLLIVAGAGTGKTTVITRRIAYLIEQGVKPEEILALAFGEKAAAEMEERVDLLLPYGYNNLQISTFHAFCELVLREHGLEIGLPDFKVLDEVGQWLLVRNHLDRFDLDYYQPLGNPTRFIKALVRHFSKAKDELVTPASYLAYAETEILKTDRAEAGIETATVENRRLREIANAYHVYDRLLLENGYLDFGDLINYTLGLFTKRPQVLQNYRMRFKYILIDEFQDTNYAQYQLFKLLAQPANNVTVVGDDDQSIFKFRGASISNILHFQKDYPQATFISLVKNYRSGQKILDAAYRFIRQNDPDRLEVKLEVSKKLLNTENPNGAIMTAVLPDYIAEARYVAETIVRRQASEKDATWNDFAILARSHDALEPFLNVLDENHLPYIYFANQGLYKKRPILDVLAYLQLLDNYHESQALYRVLRLPVFNIRHEAVIELAHHARRKAISLYESVKTAALLPDLDEASRLGLKRLLDLVQKHTQTAHTKSAEQVFIEVVNDLDWAAEAMKDYQVAQYLAAFRRRIQNFQNENQDKSLKNFLGQIHFEQEAGGGGELEFDPEAGPEAIKLMTVHGAKGLEFRHVFAVGLVDKRFPSLERPDPIELPEALVQEILPTGDIHLEEERRLFYVAMTRAKQELILTRALNYGGKLAKKPSRFLLELGLTKPAVEKATGRVVFHRPKKRAAPRLPLPKSFSFSQISTFRSCPLEYKYVHILKLPLPQPASASFGQTVHLTFRKYVEQFQHSDRAQDLFGQPPEPRLPDFQTLQQIFAESWIDDWYPNQTEKQRYREQGAKILKTFYEECQTHLPRPRYLEKKFRLKLGQYAFTGAIDRVDKTEQAELVIIDYKTGRPGPLGPVNRQQLLIYQWAAGELWQEKVQDLQYWYLGDKLEKQSFLGTAKELEELQKDLLQTIQEIVAAAENDNFYERDLKTRHRPDQECRYRKYEI